MDSRFDDVVARLERGNHVLFSKTSTCLERLSQMLGEVDHRTTILWALSFVPDIVQQLEVKHPGEMRPSLALSSAWAWARGEIRMREAQGRILDCHALAKELDDPVDVALCHAIGQACSVVHTAGHALGLPMYELTAIVLSSGLDAVGARIEEYGNRLEWWSTHTDTYKGPWASFLSTASRKERK